MAIIWSARSSDLDFSAADALSSGRTIPFPGISPSPRFDTARFIGSTLRIQLSGGATATSIPSGTIVIIRRTNGGTRYEHTVSVTANLVVGGVAQWNLMGTAAPSGGSGDWILEFDDGIVPFEFMPDTATTTLLNNADGRTSLYTVQADNPPGTAVYSLVGTPQQGVAIDSGTGEVYYTGSAANNAALPAADTSFTVQISAAVGQAMTENRFTLTVDVRAPDLIPTFGVAQITGQVYQQGQEITPLTLPMASSGDPPLSYTLTPALPDGLTRTGFQISGTPTGSPLPTQYTWQVEDDDGDTDLITFTITIMSADPVEGLRPFWREPRLWQGKSSDGADADELGEWDPTRSYGQKIPYVPNANRYDLTFEWSELLQTTLPAKAEEAGDFFVATAAHTIARLPLGAGANRAYRSTGSFIEIVETADILGDAYPTEAVNDLIVGDADGRPSRLQAPNSSTEYILSSVNGAPVWRTRGGAVYSP